MNLYKITVASSLNFEKVWHELEENGIEILYGTEEESQIEIFAYLPHEEALSNIPYIESCNPYTLPSTDWESQWEMHGHNFHEGHVCIDFTPFGKSIPPLKLEPGAGFGDLSHATTRLMLQMLASSLKNQIVIDIGCGSGILTLAAAAIGAGMSYGIDIDPEALIHSKKNGVLNQLEKKTFFFTPEAWQWQTTQKPIVILMNMISSEQKTAWNSLKNLHKQPALILTSGIQKTEKNHYITLTKQWGWTLQEIFEEGDWMGFSFIQK